MEILYLLVPLSVVMVFLIAAVFWWSLKSGQYEDMDGPAHRILQDDDRPAPLPERHNDRHVEPDKSGKFDLRQ